MEEPNAQPSPEREDSIEPGRPSIENVVFVVLGATSTLAVFLHIITLFR